jgi:hypothetical protein
MYAVAIGRSTSSASNTSPVRPMPPSVAENTSRSSGVTHRCEPSAASRVNPAT